MAKQYTSDITVNVNTKDLKKATKEAKLLEDVLNNLKGSSNLNDIFKGSKVNIDSITKALGNMKEKETATIKALKQNESYRKNLVRLKRVENQEALKGLNANKEVLKNVRAAIQLTEQRIDQNNKLTETSESTGLKPANAQGSALVKGFTGNTDFLKAKQSQLEKINEELERVDLTDEERAKLEAKKTNVSSEIKAFNTVAQAKKISTTLFKTFKDIGLKVFKTMDIDLSNIMSQVMGNITEMLKTTGIAFWDISSSIFTNSQAREIQFKYGLSDSQAYALNQTMSMLNMKTDEDLMYMNQQQKRVFNELMSKYDAWYTEFKESGAAEELQRAQLEFAMFKQELSYKLLNWFAEHRDAIMKILEFIMGCLEGLANVVEAILNVLPFGKSSSRSAWTSDSVSSNSIATTNTNVYVQNTNNATANLNSKAELDNALNGNNVDLVKRIASSIVE